MPLFQQLYDAEINFEISCLLERWRNVMPAWIDGGG